MVEWIAKTIDDRRYRGIALLMLVANLFPPIPSKLIMPLGGFTARATPDKLYVFGVFLAGIIGLVLGAIIWYYPGKFLAQTRLIFRFDVDQPESVSDSLVGVDLGSQTLPDCLLVK